MHSTFESHERDRVGRKGGVPSVHADDGRNSVLFCIREMRSRCSALARKPPPSCDRLRGDRDKWSRLKTSITRQSNKLEAARDRQLIYGPFFSPSPSLRPRPPASSTRTTYKILSSSAAAVPEHE